MSQSKLSVSSSLTPFFLPRVEKNTINSNIYVDEKKEHMKQVIAHRKWIDSLDTTYYLRVLDNLPNRIGLPKLKDSLSMFGDEENVKVLSISIKNTGDLPSTNVRVKLILRTYGTKNFYPKNPLPNKLVEREIYSENEITIPVPYMGANDERSFAIYYLHGQFREAELILLSIKANGFTYIKNHFIKNFFSPDSEIILHHYEMERLNVPRQLTEQDMKIIYGLGITSDEEKN